MTLRLKIILTLLIGVTVLVASFAVYKVVSFFQTRFANEEQLQKQQNTTPTEQDLFFKDLNVQSQNEQTPPSPVAVKPVQNDKVRADLISLALPFAERFGSYSNQSSYANLEDLLPFMTEQMQTWAKEKIGSAQSGLIPTLYKGVTTKALSHTVLSVDESKGTAQVRVATQRKELIGSSTNFKVYNQDVLLTFTKQDTVWLVDSAVWE